MKNRFTYLCLILVMALTLLTLAACGDDTPDDPKRDDPAFEGHTPVTDAAVPPSCTESGLTEGAHCADCGEILKKQETVPPTGHNWGQDTCANCGRPTPTEGLAYYEMPLADVNFERGVCIFTGPGTSTASHIVIADEYNGLPVRGINIWDVSDEWTKITIPDSVWDITTGSFEKLRSICELVDGVYYLDNWALSVDPYATSITLRPGTRGIASGCFVGCPYLETIVLPDGLKHIGVGNFSGCLVLSSLNIPDSLETLGGTEFPKNDGLRTVIDGVHYINNWVVGADSDITAATIKEGTLGIAPHAFRYCTSLASVTIPGTLKVLGKEAFRGCTALESVTVPDSITAIPAQCFAGCSALATVNLPKTVTSIGANAFSGIAITSLVLHEGITLLDDAAFHECPNLTSVTLPQSLTVLRDDVFGRCFELQQVNIHDGITSMGRYSFNGCSKLLVLENGVYYVGNWAMRHEFYAGDIIIREGTVGIADAAFDGAEFRYDTQIPSSVRYIGAGAFCNAKYLENIVIPEGVTEIRANTFNNCTGIITVQLPSTVTSIGAGAFERCMLLTQINIPKGVTEIRENTFYYCQSLPEIVLPEGVTHIADTAFQHCFVLKDITLPKTVEKLGYSMYSMYQGMGLTTIHYGGTKAEWNAAFSDYRRVGVTVHCTDGEIVIS